MIKQKRVNDPALLTALNMYTFKHAISAMNSGRLNTREDCWNLLLSIVIKQSFLPTEFIGLHVCQYVMYSLAVRLTMNLGHLYVGWPFLSIVWPLPSPLHLHLPKSFSTSFRQWNLSHLMPLFWISRAYSK